MRTLNAFDFGSCDDPNSAFSKCVDAFCAAADVDHVSGDGLLAALQQAAAESCISIDLAIAMFNAAASFERDLPSFPRPKDRAELRQQVALLYEVAGTAIHANNKRKIAARATGEGEGHD